MDVTHRAARDPGSTARRWSHLDLEGNRIAFRVLPGLIQVDNSEGEVTAALQGHARRAAVALVTLLAAAHQEALGTAIAVTPCSLAVELWMHVVADSAARTLRGPGLRRVRAAVVARTRVIDMGESARDRNRLLWDGISRLLQPLFPRPVG